MLARGANGFLHKGCHPNKLFLAINDAIHNGFHHNDLAPLAYFKTDRINYSSGFNGKVHLTENEVNLIRLSATSYTYLQIAVALGRSLKSVENSRDNLFRKLNIKSRAELVAYGLFLWTDRRQ